MSVVKIKQLHRDAPIKIDTGIPVPVGKALQKYPFGTMNVGDSFLIPGEKPGYVSTQAREFGHRHDRKFTVRKTEEGYRCWRIK